MLRCVLKHSKVSILKGYTVHKYCKKKSKMSSNRMKVADCCTTIVRASYDNKSVTIYDLP